MNNLNELGFLTCINKLLMKCLIFLPLLLGHNSHPCSHAIGIIQSPGSGVASSGGSRANLYLLFTLGYN